MEIKKINKFKTHLPKKGAFTIPTDDDFMRLHTLTIASGKRGGGKSVAVANIVKEAKDRGYFDRVWLITPTYASNKSIWEICDIDEEDVIEPDINSIKILKQNVEAEKAEWDDFQKRKKLYKKYKEEIANKPIDLIRGRDLVEYLDAGFLDYDFNEEWKYGKERPPRLACIIDDCMGTDLMTKRTAGLTNLAIRHRHIGDGLGISLFMLVQSYCSRDGLARPIRENTTHLMLFKINDQNQIKKVKEESDLPITDEEWETMCEYAHSKPFNYLFIDFSPKCETKRFRDGYNSYIVPESLKDKCSCNKKN
jgi:hypothetical protein